MQLNNIKAHPGATKSKKRLGRGSGSGHGVTSGKGDKGQLARSGGSVRPGFEGGQMPLYRRVPKRGFNNFARRITAIVNIGDLDTFDFSKGGEVTLDALEKGGFIKGRHEKLSVLGGGETKKALIVKAHRVSASAVKKIEAAGGKVEIIRPPRFKRAKKTEKKAEKQAAK
ncbi:MAG: 50S ribosomal protein L15 [Bdellovibrionales bacterium RIFOXYD1_FULL_53_11]|nr:MAG: 50S ribosomal protein L15 [Bdellovibrionales bacterium RIFOXYD1_FULL_53_11]